MGLEKTEMQRELLFSMGLRVDDRIEALKAEQNRLEGAAGAFKESAVKIEADVMGRLQKEIEGGTVSLEVAAVVKKYVGTCIHYLQHLEKQMMQRTLLAQGQLIEAQRSVAELKQLHDEAASKAKVLAANPDALPHEGPGPSRRVPGQHPISLKQHRLAAVEEKPKKMRKPKKLNGTAEKSGVRDSG